MGSLHILFLRYNLLSVFPCLLGFLFFLATILMDQLNLKPVDYAHLFSTLTIF